MKIKFNAIGDSRKELARAVGNILGRVPVYKGVPSFAYVISNVIIAKDGTLTWDERTDNATIQNLVERLGEAGFFPEREEDEQSKANETLTIEMPLEGFTEAAIVNLERMVASKAELIKKAIGTHTLLIERSETTIRFPWFPVNSTGDEIATYSSLITALCDAAKEQKRVTAKEKVVDNEKFAFRVFLIRLGFVGDDYKVARKILLRNLSGNSAFKSGTPLKITEDMGNE